MSWYCAVKLNSAATESVAGLCGRLRDRLRIPDPDRPSQPSRGDPAPDRDLHGAGHESGRRAGTENILLDVGLGAACALAESWVGMEPVRQLLDLFWNLLRERFGSNVVLNGHPDERLPNTLNVSFVN